MSGHNLWGPDRYIPWAGRVGARGGAADGVGQDWMPTELFAQATRDLRIFQGIEETSRERFSRRTNKQILCKPVESKTLAYNGRVWSGRPIRRLGGVGKDWVPTKLFAEETKVIRTLQNIDEP